MTRLYLYQYLLHILYQFTDIGFCCPAYKLDFSDDFHQTKDGDIRGLYRYYTTDHRNLPVYKRWKEPDDEGPDLFLFKAYADLNAKKHTQGDYWKVNIHILLK